MDLKQALLLGDSIRIGYQPYVRRELAGRIEVTGPEENCGNTETYLAELERWLASHPTIVHLNTGLHDLARTIGTSQRRVPMDVYTRNLETIFQRLAERRGVRVIWATITPIDDRKWNGCPERAYDRFNEDIAPYNAAALGVCRRFGISINDLHAAVVEAGAEKLLDPDGIHFTDAGYVFLAREVAEAIRTRCSD